MKFTILFLLAATFSGCASFLPAAPATQPGAAPTTINVPAGTDIAPLLAKAKAYTTIVNAPGGAMQIDATVFMLAGQDNVTVDVNGGTIATIPTKGSSAIIALRGAQHFTLKNAAGVTGDTSTVFASVQSSHATFDNVRGVKGLLKFIDCENANSYKILNGVPVATSTGRSGDFLTVTNCETLGPASYSVYIEGVTDAKIENNVFGQSYGESDVRVDGLTIAPAVVVRANRISIVNNKAADHNTFGKPPLQVRNGNNVIVSANLFDGWARFGDIGNITQTGSCSGLTVTGNTFLNCDGAVQVFTGCSGSITGNIFTVSASRVSPIVVGPMNMMTISGNLMQVAPGQVVKPIVAPTSNAGSYHADCTNVVKVIASTQAGK